MIYFFDAAHCWWSEKHTCMTRKKLQKSTVTRGRCCTLRAKRSSLSPWGRHVGSVAFLCVAVELGDGHCPSNPTFHPLKSTEDILKDFSWVKPDFGGSTKKDEWIKKMVLICLDMALSCCISDHKINIVLRWKACKIHHVEKNSNRDFLASGKAFFLCNESVGVLDDDYLGLALSHQWREKAEIWSENSHPDSFWRSPGLKINMLVFL